MKIPPNLVRAGLRSLRPVFTSTRVTMAKKRRVIDALAGLSKLPVGAAVETGVLAGVPIQRVTPAGVSTHRVLLFLHGGGYGSGSAFGYRAFGGILAASADMCAVIPDYRLAPEHPFPAAFDDAVSVYSALLEQVAAGEISQIVVAGDSAGGGLALALVEWARDSGLPLPASLGLICPWLDLDLDYNGRRLARKDPLIIPALVADWCRPYVRAADPRDPRISPLHGDLRGLPSIVLHSASDDPLAADAEKLEREFARQAGSGVLIHRRYTRRWHDFHLQVGFLADADSAVQDIGTQLRDLAADRQVQPDRSVGL